MEISLFAKANISLWNSLISSRKDVIVLQFRLWKHDKKTVPLEKGFAWDHRLELLRRIHSVFVAHAIRLFLVCCSPVEFLWDYDILWGCSYSMVTIILQNLARHFWSLLVYLVHAVRFENIDFTIRSNVYTCRNRSQIFWIRQLRKC